MDNKLNDVLQESKPIEGAEVPGTATDTSSGVRSVVNRLLTAPSFLLGFIANLKSRGSSPESGVSGTVYSSSANQVKKEPSQAADPAPGGSTAVVQTTLQKSRKPMNPMIKKLLGKFVVLLVVIGVIYAGLKIIGNIGENGGIGRNGGGDGPTPTLSQVKPEELSIYSQDLEMVQLEIDINTLDRELSSTVLREGNLTPPRLDFDVKF